MNRYYLKDVYGMYYSYILLCNTACEYPPTNNCNSAAIYTEEQLNVAQRYFKRKKKHVFSELVVKSEKKRKKEKEYDTSPNNS